MLQMSLKWRAISTAASLLLGIVITAIWGFGFSFMFWIVFVVFVVGYFLLGTLSAGAKQLQLGDLDGAERILNYTWKPEWMLKINRAYYHMIKGTIAMQRKQFPEAEERFKSAQEIGLATDNDKAMVLLNLAQINYNKGKFPAAKAQIREIKALSVTEPMIMQNVKEVEKYLKVRPNGMSQMMYGKAMGKKMMSRARSAQPTTPKKSGNNRKKKKRK